MYDKNMCNWNNKKKEEEVEEKGEEEEKEKERKRRRKEGCGHMFWIYLISPSSIIKFLIRILKNLGALAQREMDSL